MIFVYGLCVNNVNYLLYILYNTQIMIIFVKI